jgi:tetratricopeptide (TPR) repeat protein
MAMFGGARTAQEFVELALKVSENLHAHAAILAMQGCLYIHRQRWVDAVDAFAQSNRYAEQNHDQDMRTLALWSLAYIDFCQGRYEPALEWATRCSETATKYKNDWMVYESRLLRFHAHLRLDQLDLAMAVASELGGFPKALCFVHQGDFAKAFDMVRPALEAKLAAQRLRPILHRDLLVHLIDTELFVSVLERGRQDMPRLEWERFMAVAHVVVHNFAKFAEVFHFARPFAQLSLGILYWQQERHSKARKSLSLALQMSQAPGMEYTRGLSHSQLARHSYAHAATTHLARMVEAFTVIHAHPILVQRTMIEQHGLLPLAAPTASGMNPINPEVAVKSDESVPELASVKELIRQHPSKSKDAFIAILGTLADPDCAVPAGSMRMLKRLPSSGFTGFRLGRPLVRKLAQSVFDWNPCRIFKADSTDKFLCYLGLAACLLHDRDTVKAFSILNGLVYMGAGHSYPSAEVRCYKEIRDVLRVMALDDLRLPGSHPHTRT